MPRYFFHLIDSIDVTLDSDGMEMPPSAVFGVASLQARDCIAGDVMAGRLDFNYRIDVHNEAGQLVHSLSFAEALKIVPPR